eukprot:m.276886 g.276886  ORF g.276886 m.276886 type:complete len:209 (-) comp15716_c0_seq2:4129-4755(-)
MAQTCFAKIKGLPLSECSPDLIDMIEAQHLLIANLDSLAPGHRKKLRLFAQQCIDVQVTRHLQGQSGDGAPNRSSIASLGKDHDFCDRHQAQQRAAQVPGSMSSVHAITIHSTAGSAASTMEHILTALSQHSDDDSLSTVLQRTPHHRCVRLLQAVDLPILEYFQRNTSECLDELDEPLLAGHRRKLLLSVTYAVDQLVLRMVVPQSL